jgi:hypothetical protein
VVVRRPRQRHVCLVIDADEEGKPSPDSLQLGRFDAGHELVIERDPRVVVVRARGAFGFGARDQAVVAEAACDEAMPWSQMSAVDVEGHEHLPLRQGGPAGRDRLRASLSPR